MKSGMKDKAKGTIHEAKGMTKEMAGKRGLEAKGSVERTTGQAQKKAGPAKKVPGK